MKKLTAVVNDELLMMTEEALTPSTQDAFFDNLDRISNAITEKVTSDQRFVDAVGIENAIKCSFNILPEFFDCDECGTRHFIMHIIMMLGNEETDFYYEYFLATIGNDEGMEHVLTVLYNNGGKSQLMKVFENTANGITSTKTFGNIHGNEGHKEVTIEDIFSEILSEGDLKIY